MSTVTMHGPSFDGTGEIEEQEVDALNLHAYKVHGWTEGPKPVEEETETVEVFEADSSGASKSLGKVTRAKKSSQGAK